MPPITAVCLCNALIAGVLSLSVSFCRFSVWPRPRRSWIYGEITDYSCTLLYVCPCWCLLFLRRNFVLFSFVWVGFSVCVCVFIQIYIFVFVFCGCVTRLISHDRGIIVIWQYYIYTVTHSVCIYIYCVCVCVYIVYVLHYADSLCWSCKSMKTNIREKLCINSAHRWSPLCLCDSVSTVCSSKSLSRL